MRAARQLQCPFQAAPPLQTRTNKIPDTQEDLLDVCSKKTVAASWGACPVVMELPVRAHAGIGSQIWVSRRPAGKARNRRDMHILRGLATQPGGMHRRPRWEVVSACALSGFSSYKLDSGALASLGDIRDAQPHWRRIRLSVHLSPEIRRRSGRAVRSIRLDAWFGRSTLAVNHPELGECVGVLNLRPCQVYEYRRGQVIP